MTQLKLGEDPTKVGEYLQEQKDEMQKQQEENRKWEEERRRNEAEFNKSFKEGSTTVAKHNGKFYFWGDVSHCGKESIFHNAKEIRNRMLQRGAIFGHMSCTDLPTFEKVYPDWEKDEKQRKLLYKDDLYSFNGDEIVIEDLIGDEEQKQIYCLNEEKL